MPCPSVPSAASGTRRAWVEGASGSVPPNSLRARAEVHAGRPERSIAAQNTAMYRNFFLSWPQADLAIGDIDQFERRYACDPLGRAYAIEQA